MQADCPAKRVANYRNGLMFGLMQQLGDVVDIVGETIAAPDHPLRITVAAQVRSNDMPIFAQGFCDPIPIPAMVSTTMYEKKWRRVRIAPVDVVKT